MQMHGSFEGFSPKLQWLVFRDFPDIVPCLAWEEGRKHQLKK